MRLLPRTRNKRGVRITGVARIGLRTKQLATRISRGEIAIINHRDIDRIAADGLLEAGVAAVVNADHSISGRYPNGGPERIVQAGVPLFDAREPGLCDLVREGETITIRDDALWRGDQCIVELDPLPAAVVEDRLAQARLNVGAELRAFAKNTLEYIDLEAEETFAPLVLPPLKTTIKGRHALVVVRGLDYKRDLRMLRAYIREYKPALIAVDGGADALIDGGRTPDIIIGDFDSLTPVAMRCGAQLIHHVHPDGRAPGRERLLEAQVPFDTFVAEGTSEDAAMLLAYEAGADLIVAVGTHATMVEFLDKGRKGMASTFLTRLRIGPLLVDAKGVSRLYQGRVRNRDMLFLVGSAVLAMIAMVRASHSLQVFMDGFRLMLEHTWTRITDAF